MSPRTELADALAGLRLALRYSEDQPRDEHGRWEDAGGAGESLARTERLDGEAYGKPVEVHINPTPGMLSQMMRKSVAAEVTGSPQVRALAIGDDVATADAGALTHFNMANVLKDQAHPLAGAVNVKDMRNHWLIWPDTTGGGPLAYSMPGYPGMVNVAQYDRPRQAYGAFVPQPAERWPLGLRRAMGVGTKAAADALAELTAILWLYRPEQHPSN